MAAPAWPWTTRLLFLFLCVAWGFNFLFIRVGLSDASPLWLSLLRGVIGTAATVFIVTPLKAWGKLDARGRRDALLLGIPTTTAFYALLIVGIETVLPGVASVVTYTFPLWVALLSPSVLGHRLARSHWLSVVAGFAGVALIAQFWAAASGRESAVGVLELLGGALAWALGTVLFQRRFSRAQMLEANAYQLLGGTAGLAVAVLVVAPTPLPTVGLDLWVSLVWLGIVGTAIAWSIWFDLLGRTRAAALSAYVFLVPVVALIGSAVFFGERLSAVQLAGVGLVLLSVYGIGRAEARAVGPDRPDPTPSPGTPPADPSA